MRILYDLKTIFRFQKMAANHCPSYLWVLSTLTLFSALQPFIMVVFPRFILDEVFGSRDLTLIILYISAMSISTILCGILNAFLTNRLHFISMQLKSILRMNMAYQTTQIPYAMLEDAAILNQKQNATKFLEEDIDRAIYVTPKFFSSLFAALGYIYIISNLNIWILLVLITVILINTKLQNNTEKYAYTYRNHLAPVERKISYFIMTMPNVKFGKDIRIYNMQDWLFQKYNQQLKETLDGYKKVFSNRSRNTILSTITSTVQTVCIYAWLIYQAFIGYLTVGQFTMYFSAISNFSGNIIQIFSSFVQISAIKRGLNDFLSFMELPQENKASLPSSTFNSMTSCPIITFEHVWFQYPEQSDFALKDVSIQIPYGQKICIVGENGAGKTTFVKLLSRLYTPSKGQIKINGIDIQTFPLTQYHDLLSVVFQDFTTFAFTIHENIALADSNAPESRSQTEEVLAKVDLDHTIHSLPHSIDTYLETVFNENGIQLSGGQTQRLALARAIYHDAPILILDEPTAALDPRAEYNIYQNFYKISQSKTTLFISHRLASAHFCDRILVFQNGQIIEDGTHASLLQEQGLYWELYNMQKQYYEDE